MKGKQVRMNDQLPSLKGAEIVRTGKRTNVGAYVFARHKLHNKPLFLAPAGLGCYANFYAGQFAELLSAELPVAVVEMRGVGLNNRLVTTPANARKENAQDLYDIIKKLGATDIILCPHSAGAFNSMALLKMINEDPRLNVITVILNAAGLPGLPQAFPKGPGILLWAAGRTSTWRTSVMCKGMPKGEVTDAAANAMAFTMELYRVVAPTLLRLLRTKKQGREMFSRYLKEACELSPANVVPILYSGATQTDEIVEEIKLLRNTPRLHLGYGKDIWISPRTADLVEDIIGERSWRIDKREVIENETHFGHLSSADEVVGRIFQFLSEARVL